VTTLCLASRKFNIHVALFIFGVSLVLVNLVAVIQGRLDRMGKRTVRDLGGMPCER
jgi:hypothetical protein